MVSRFVTVGKLAVRSSIPWNRGDNAGGTLSKSGDEYREIVSSTSTCRIGYALCKAIFSGDVCCLLLLIHCVQRPVLASIYDSGVFRAHYGSSKENVSKCGPIDSLREKLSEIMCSMTCVLSPHRSVPFVICMMGITCLVVGHWKWSVCCAFRTTLSSIKHNFWMMYLISSLTVFLLLRPRETLMLVRICDGNRSLPMILIADQN